MKREEKNTVGKGMDEIRIFSSFQSHLFLMEVRRTKHTNLGVQLDEFGQTFKTRFVNIFERTKKNVHML